MLNAFLQSEAKVKNKLTNTILLVGSVVGAPLLALTYIRAITFNTHPSFLAVTLIETFIFATFIALYAFRNKISFNVRGWFIIAITFSIASIDFWQVGFISLGYIWLVAAVVFGVLMFGFRKGIYITLLSGVLIFVFYLIKKLELRDYGLDFNQLADSNITILVRSFTYLVVSLTILFSIKLIFETLNKWNKQLVKQAEELLESTRLLQQEIEVRKKTEQQALDNEFKFRNIFELSTDPISIIDMNGKFLDFNFSFLNLIGKEAHLYTGAYYLDFLPDEYKNDFKKYKNNLGNLPKRFEIKYRRTDGTIIYLDVSTTLINFSTGDAILTVFRDNTEKINHERLIFSAALEAEEKERLRLSKELHDGLGPLLSTLRIYLEVLEKRPGDPEIQQRINTTLNESIKSVKEISNNLSPYVLQNLGIVKALKSFIEKISFNNKLKIKFETNIENRLNEKREIAIYRLITELLNNTLKYATAEQVIIELNINDNMLSINYSDDGIGFDMETIKEKSTGIGLFNIQSRIEKLGGTISINTKPGEGFKFKSQIIIDN